MKLIKRLLGIEQKDAIIEQLQETLSRVFDNNRKIAEMGINKEKYKKRIELLKQRLELQAKLHEEEIKKIEKSLEGTIDKQAEKINELEQALSMKNFDSKDSGKFFVYNPKGHKPKKTYLNYLQAYNDALAVANISGDEVLVLKVLTSIKVDTKDETQKSSLDDLSEEIPY